MSESRGELIAWVNELLQLNYTKVEQLGTGAAYAQIMDSIYGDLPMQRVKFATKHEYEYLGNYKVLQTCFTNRKIDKAVPTERLMKCKMQDNLEFLQWIKKFWDRNFPGDHYDAAARRGAANEPLAAANRSTSSPARRAMNNNGANRSMSGRGSVDHLSAAANRSLRGPSPDHSVVLALQKELQEERTTVAALEKERDFYFGKLRDIEVLIQQESERSPDTAEIPLLKEIQAVLYSTEEGFEIPLEEHAAEAEEYPDETF
ncbi:MAG: EB1 domain-containing protein [Linnemannia elongata]|nr:MAG: EB1 domain-containing protein [Linnemannia elongata]